VELVGGRAVNEQTATRITRCDRVSISTFWVLRNRAGYVSIGAHDRNRERWGSDDCQEVAVIQFLALNRGFRRHVFRLDSEPPSGGLLDPTRAE
jgi:hypothetical protein